MGGDGGRARGRHALVMCTIEGLHAPRPLPEPPDELLVTCSAARMAQPHFVPKTIRMGQRHKQTRRSHADTLAVHAARMTACMRMRRHACCMHVDLPLMHAARMQAVPTFCACMHSNTSNACSRRQTLACAGRLSMFAPHMTWQLD